MRKISKILVANRGEIALRVMRTAREMGIKTVAVYSEADKSSPHVLFADEAVCLGPPPSSQSYLLGDKIIEVCQRLNVDAVHPGYGFLSENSGFARKLENANIILIGPSADSMDLMGNKISAKQTVKNYDIPLVPGTDMPLKDINEALEVAEKTGFPLLIKAAAGGGGKGMRIVNRIEDVEQQMHMAINEAVSAFGDGSIFIEKYIGRPRHIEIQLIGDQQGNVVYLFERECSIQRRHQKLVEEAPSSLLSPEIRKAMGEAAVRVAKACGYYGAGTVEFLCDENQQFYFLEMNTRLQVEHTVSEMITGLDLVREQILVAEGKPLSYSQEDLEINGHSIELRICAEDPMNDFLPDTGKLEVYRRPQGHGIRVDDGFEEGMDIPIFYDSMIAKLVVHAGTREDAIDKMKRAIDDFSITGITTTLQFGKFVMDHPQFIKGDFDTNFINKYFKPEMLLPEFTESELEASSVFSDFFQNQKKQASTFQTSENTRNNWQTKRL